VRYVFARFLLQQCQEQGSIYLHLICTNSSMRGFVSQFVRNAQRIDSTASTFP